MLDNNRHFVHFVVTHAYTDGSYAVAVTHSLDVAKTVHAMNECTDEFGKYNPARIYPVTPERGSKQWLGFPFLSPAQDFDPEAGWLSRADLDATEEELTLLSHNH